MQVVLGSDPAGSGEIGGVVRVVKVLTLSGSKL